VCLFFISPAGGIQKIARTRNVKFRQFGVFSNAQQGIQKIVWKLAKPTTEVLFKGNTVALKKLKSFLKIIQNHNNQMPPLNISQNVFTNYKRACFEYRKLLGCKL
jgi:hypothetical protein